MVGDVLQDVLEHLVFGIGERDAVRDLLDQPALAVHVRHELVHVVERRLVGLDHDREPRIDQIQVVVGDDDGDLDEFVDVDIESRHFAIDPDEQI